MPRRKPVELLTQSQRDAIRARFSSERDWMREAATSFGLDTTLHTQPLPKGWLWRGAVFFNAACDVVEGTIAKGDREVEVVCTAVEARDPVKLWPIIHEAIHHGSCTPTWGRRLPKMPKLPVQ